MDQERGARQKLFLDAHPGLRGKLRIKHPIIRSIKRYLSKNGTITDAQLDVVERFIARRREWQAAELLKSRVRAPSGRCDVIAKVLAVKYVEHPDGGTLRMLIEVEKKDVGVWQAWGPVPFYHAGVEPGDVVRFSAVFTPKEDDIYFAWFKRPVRIKQTPRKVLIAKMRTNRANAG